MQVASARERGLKYEAKITPRQTKSRSREGAWIEINLQARCFCLVMVAPARERGLKLLHREHTLCHYSRSREGAWIEISARPCGHKYNKGRSREGAWIEIRRI